MPAKNLIFQKLKLLLPVNALIIALIAGSISLISIYANVHFYIPGTNVLSDAREIFNSLGAAISGPVGGFIIGTISCLISPSEEIKFYIIFQHWVSAVWIGWAYKKLIFEKMKMPELILGWFFLILVYYFITYLPGYFITYFFFPNVYHSLVGGELPPVETLLKLFRGWVPEIIFTSIYTSLVIIALPNRFRKPLWGRSISKEDNQGIKQISFWGKRFKINYLAARLSIWFILLFTIPLVFISILTRNYFLDYFLKAEALQQIESIDRIENMVELSENNFTGIKPIIKNNNTAGTRLVLLTDESFNLVYGQQYFSTQFQNKNLLTEEIKSQILSKKNGSHIDDIAGFAVAFRYNKENKVFIVSFSPPGKYNNDLREFANLITKNLGITLLIISLATGLIIWILVGNPLKKLAIVTERIGKGDYSDHASSPELIDEVLILGNAIDRMKNNIRNTQTELANSEYKFRTLFETANDAIIIIESDVMIDCNNKTLDLFQRTREDILNRSVIEYSPSLQTNGELSSEVVSLKIEAALNGVSQFFEWDLLTPTGDVINTEISLNRFLLEDKYFIQAIVRNITERIQYEHQLIEAKNEAEKADRIKSEFLSQISHEIRTPLHIILSNISIIQELLGEDATKDLVKYWDNAKNASNRMTRTIELIIKMAEIQGGAYKPSFINFNLVKDVLKDLIVEFTILAEKKHLTLELIRLTNETIVFCDKSNMINIAANLIDNAIKFTKAGKVEVVVDNYDDNFLLMKVIDTGCGISNDYLPNIYDIFSQEEQGLNRTFDGNGLGLAIAKRYCDNNDIKIRIETEKGKGSTFSLLIPRKRT
ncbi:MAG: multi-sensor hybrid histidine kinase [Ignavibacteria bacterium]|nr:MAG: multi-sensor hybrid histidine kinase [Ignavibacteria bacterium]KAF0161911.1 MAG: multi-sensor hybrid histidine kinase [Ignavibacteria bacterium]